MTTAFVIVTSLKKVHIKIFVKPEMIPLKPQLESGSKMVPSPHSIISIFPHRFCLFIFPNTDNGEARDLSHRGGCALVVHSKTQDKILRLMIFLFI